MVNAAENTQDDSLERGSFDLRKNYFSPDELRRMPAENVEKIWDLVDNEHRVSLEQAYQRELARRGISSDEQELDLIRMLLGAYIEQGVIPTDGLWADVSPGMRKRFESGFVEEEEVEVEDEGRSEKPKFPKWLIAGVAVVGVLLFLRLAFVVVGNLASGGEQEVVLDVTETPTQTPSATFTPSPTPTLTPTPTATPIPLVNPDAPILAGDVDGSYFPVLLQIDLGDGSAVNSYVVQEQKVAVAEWVYDPNPAIVSWLSGMIVRPILGLPYSTVNQALIEAIGEGTQFRVQMNTGDVFVYNYVASYQVQRTDTSVFQQFEPGLVLAVLGERDRNGLPTAARWVVEAAYSVEQETARFNRFAIPIYEIGSIVPMPYVNSSLSVIEVTVYAQADLPPAQGYSVVDLQISTGDEGLESGDLIVSLQDRVGDIYNVDATASMIGECDPLPGSLPPNSSGCYSVGFITSRFIQQGRLYVEFPRAQVSEEAYVNLQFERDSSITVNGLIVDVQSMTYDPDTFFLKVRVYNPTSQDIEIDGTELFSIFSFSQPPVGPRTMPTDFEIQVIRSGQAVDFDLEYFYRSEPYSLVNLFGFEYLVIIQNQ